MQRFDQILYLKIVTTKVKVDFDWSQFLDL